MKRKILYGVASYSKPESFKIIKDNQVPSKQTRLENKSDPILCLDANTHSNKIDHVQGVEFEKHKKALPKSKEWYLKRANIFRDLGIYDYALDMFNSITNLEPDNDSAWCNKGYCLEMVGKREDAIKAYDEALRINFNHAESWYNKGVSLRKLGRNEEAIKAYDEALRINPNYVKAWYNKGVSLRKLGRNEEAIKAYDEALRINPNYVTVEVFTKKEIDSETAKMHIIQKNGYGTIYTRSR